MYLEQIVIPVTWNASVEAGCHLKSANLLDCTSFLSSNTTTSKRSRLWRLVATAVETCRPKFYLHKNLKQCAQATGTNNDLGAEASLH